MKPLFPKWTNRLPLIAAMGLLSFVFVAVGGTWYYATPSFWEVGYMPDQPVNYSHQIHAGKLGMDCQYCHTAVKESKTANIPAVSTCMNCHTVVDDKSGYLKLATSADGTKPSLHWSSPDLMKLRAYWNANEAIPWKRVHKLPDYVNFTHAAHLNAGVSCYSCHSRIDEMPVVHQTKSLSMAFCLDCHRAPENELVDPSRVTDLAWVQAELAKPDYASELGDQLAAHLRYAPPQNCSACHY